MALRFSGNVAIWNAPGKSYVIQQYKDRCGVPYGIVHASTMKKRKVYGRDKWTIDCVVELFFFNSAYDKLNKYGLREGDTITITDGTITTWKSYKGGNGKQYIFRVRDFEIYTSWSKKKTERKELNIPRDPVIVSEEDEKEDGVTLPNLPF